MKLFKGITLKLFLVCFIFVLGSVLLLSAISYRYLNNEILNSQFEYANQMLSKLDQFIDLYYSLLQSNLEGIARTAPMWNGDLATAQSQLIDLYEDNFMYFSNVYLIKEDLSIIGGNPITKVLSEPRDERRSIFQHAFDDGDIVFSEPYRSTYSGWTITAAKSINSMDIPLVIAIDLSLSGIEERMLKISNSHDYQLGVISQSGLRIALSYRVNSMIRENDYMLQVGELTSDSLTRPVESVLTTRTQNSESLTVIKKYIDKLGWTAFAVMDQTRLERSFHSLQIHFISMLLAGFLLSLIVSILITRTIRRPVFYLMQKMRQVKEGDLEVQVATRHLNDEFGELANTFDDMLEQIRKLIRDLNASEKLKRELEIQVLHSQINPHFLYNTLGTISNLVDLERYDEVDPVISSLISMLKYGISDGAKQVTLQDEIEHVVHYVNIQNNRYQINFPLHIEIASPLFKLKLPRMVLQPIVENSLFHGYRGGLMKGEIRISAFSVDDLITIEISDNGVGMDEAKCHNILEYQKDSEFKRRSIGLYNVHKRLQLQFGEEYGLRVNSQLGVGTTVRIDLPKGGLAE